MSFIVLLLVNTINKSLCCKKIYFACIHLISLISVSYSTHVVVCCIILRVGMREILIGEQSAEDVAKAKTL